MHTIGSEIVRVANGQSAQHAGEPATGHATWNGMHLEPGYYFALLPRRGRSRHCDARVHYFGPHRSQVEARFLALSALAFGLVEPEPAERQSVLPQRARRVAAPAVAAAARL